MSGFQTSSTKSTPSIIPSGSRKVIGSSGLRFFANSSETHLDLIDKNVQMPPLKTIADSMVVDDKGNLWVETYEEKEEQGKTYTAFDIFNEDGIYEAKVWLDRSIGIFRNGKMYARVTDEETGYRVYKRYRVIWSDQE